MEKSKSKVFPVILIICLLLSVALNIVLVLNITGKFDIDFIGSEQKSEAGIDYERVSGIYLYINYNEQNNTAEQSVFIEKQQNTCQISVYDAGDLDRSGEFSSDVFQDVVDTMRENNLPVYKPQTNEYGQVVKGVVKYKLTVDTFHEKTDLDATTVNAADLVAKIITLGNNIQ